ncbi:hypothetical protein LRP52_44645 [Photobacterium sp. ZSDE20]|nr:hypothetical protein [Photobacterium sp. ZSDE20]
MPRPIRTRTDEEWEAMIRTQCESGLSVAKFCRQNNIDRQAFYRHRNRIELKTLQAGVEEFVKVNEVMKLHMMSHPPLSIARHPFL